MSIGEIGFNAILVFLESYRANAFVQFGASADGDICQTMIELGSQGQISGGPSFVVGAVIADRLVVEPNPMEWTIHEVWNLWGEVREPLERERIDPARAGLVPWKDSFIDYGYTVAMFDECGCRRRAAGTRADDQDINCRHAWP
jgi:hypothetical protein